MMIDAWILRTSDYKESSKLVVAMSETGVFSFLAKGIRQYKSPYRHLIEPFRHVQLSLTKGSLPALKDVQPLGEMTSWSSLEVISYVEHLAELFYTLRDTIAFDRLYPYWQEVLHVLPNDPEGYGMMMEIKLLYVMGITPVFDRCVQCGSTERQGFSVSQGGMLCKQHQTTDIITNAEVILAMYQLYHQDVEAPLPTFERAALRKLLDQYYSYHVHVETTARQLIRSIYHT
jgi:DNA repair protein RecO (recombination protein O)